MRSRRHLARVGGPHALGARTNAVLLGSAAGGATGKFFRRGRGDIAERRGLGKLDGALFARSVENARAQLDPDNAYKRGKNGRNERREKKVGGVGGAGGGAHADDGCGQDLQARRGNDGQHYHVGRGARRAVVHAVDGSDRHGRGGVPQTQKVGGNVHRDVLARFDVAGREQPRDHGSE